MNDSANFGAMWSSKLTAIFEVLYPKISNAGLQFPTLQRMKTGSVLSFE